MVMERLEALNISIHALLAESDQIFSDPGHWTELFQSTLSLRRATRASRYSRQRILYFNPRSPCGERQPLG